MASELYIKTNGLYNITSINNLNSIFELGILSKNMLNSSIQYTDISNPSVQARRDNVVFQNGTRLHDYANLYFNPRNAMMYSKRPQIDNICVLKIDKSVLDFHNTIVADRNASVYGARFLPPVQAIRELDFDTIYSISWDFANPIEKMRVKALMMAEVLVFDCVLPQYILEIWVGNEVAYDKVCSLKLPVPVRIKPKIFFEG